MRARLWAALASAVVTAGMFTAPANGTTSPTAGSPPDPAITRRVFHPADIAEARAYWTPERMRAAQAHVVGSPAGAEPVPAAATQARRRSIVTVPSSVGAVGPSNGEGTDWVRALDAQTVPRPYTDLPDRVNVKVFFTDATGAPDFCSGTVVNSTSKRMVSTAGHCLSNGRGTLHDNFTVVPAYSSDASGTAQAPFGAWFVRALVVADEWRFSRNFKQDIGFLVLEDRPSGRIVNVVGGQGIVFNSPRDQQYLAYGYPGNPRDAVFNGFDQFVCPSGWLGDDVATPGVGPAPIRISCNMTAGSSGGGFVVRTSPNGLGRLAGLNSYRRSDNPNLTYSPYFGTVGLRLYRAAEALG